MGSPRVPHAECSRTASQQPKTVQMLILISITGVGVDFAFWLYLSCSLLPWLSLTNSLCRRLCQCCCCGCCCCCCRFRCCPCLAAAAVAVIGVGVGVAVTVVVDVLVVVVAVAVSLIPLVAVVVVGAVAAAIQRTGLLRLVGAVSA